MEISTDELGVSDVARDIHHEEERGVLPKIISTMNGEVNH